MLRCNTLISLYRKNAEIEKALQKQITELEQSEKDLMESYSKIVISNF